MKKTIVLGVSGGIAAFKAAQLTSDLIKKGYDVEVIMTQNATEFISPLTFESLTKHNVMVSTFEKVADRSVKHISIAQRADLFVIVPASANVIAKVVHGIADDMLTTTFLAASCKKMICPAMNTNMYENPVTQSNLAACLSLGYELIEPATGLLACGDVGKGKLADLENIMEHIEHALDTSDILQGKRVLVTAGPTQEALDPVRFISNHSSGKMGYEIARAARNMGAEVTLISGPCNLQPPLDINVIHIKSAMDMMEAVQDLYATQDFIIKAAAVGDYRAQSIADNKIKKQGDTLNIEFIKNPDILAYLGEHKKNHQLLCGFAMETQDLLQNAKAKLEKKHCDMIIANNLLVEGAGFQHDTNVVTMIEKEKHTDFTRMSKYDIGVAILHRLLEIHNEKEGKGSC
ncbi:bifunctional phosphopantothenoylcysteine decarboxylase/phosphopantothenate--cysteine ligase CoaBC [Amedibacillus sp. YH-ame10]